MSIWYLQYSYLQVTPNVSPVVRYRNNHLCIPLVPPCVRFLDNPRQTSRVPVYIRVLDVNDNAPTFAANYETFVCENAKANQVGATGPLSWFPFSFPLCPH